MVEYEFEDDPANCYLDLMIKATSNDKGLAIEIATNSATLREEARNIEKFDTYSYAIIINPTTFEIVGLLVIYKVKPGYARKKLIETFTAAGWTVEEKQENEIYFRKKSPPWKLPIEGTGRATGVTEVDLSRWG